MASRRLSPALALTLFGVGTVSLSAYALNFPTVGGVATLLNQTNIAGPNGTGYLHAGAQSQRCADMDGDGDVDILTGAGPYVEGVHVGLKRSTGFHYDVYNYGNGIDDNDAVWGFDIADIDADGDTDVITYEKSAAGIWSLERYSNNGAGVLSRSTILVMNATNLGYGEEPNFGDEPTQPLAMGDFNGDGRPDIALITGFRLEIFLNLGGGAFSRLTPVDPSAAIYFDSARDLQVGDIDGDGDLDIVSAAWTNGAFVFKNGGAGNFSMTQRFATTAAIWSNGDLGDADGDGDLDYVLKGRRAGKLQLFRNNGVGSFGSDTTVATGSFEYGMFLDVDADGDDDYYYQNVLYESNGGALTLRGTASTGNHIRGACDLDSDGDFEALFANYMVATLATGLPGGGGCPTARISVRAPTTRSTLTPTASLPAATSAPPTAPMMSTMTAIAPTRTTAR